MLLQSGRGGVVAGQRQKAAGAAGIERSHGRGAAQVKFKAIKWEAIWSGQPGAGVGPGQAELRQADASGTRTRPAVRRSEGTATGRGALIRPQPAARRGGHPARLQNANDDCRPLLAGLLGLGDEVRRPDSRSLMATGSGAMAWLWVGRGGQTAHVAQHSVRRDSAVGLGRAR